MNDLIDKIQKRIDLADKNHVIDTEISVKVLRQVIREVEAWKRATHAASDDVMQLQAHIEELTAENIRYRAGLNSAREWLFVETRAGLVRQVETALRKINAALKAHIEESEVN